MLKSLGIVALAFMAMGFQSASADWTFKGQLRVGMSKQEFARLSETLAAASRCNPPLPLEIPVGDVEICSWTTRSLAVAALLVRDTKGAQRVAAYSVKGAASSFNALTEGLREQLGKPARDAKGRWGQNTVWQMGGSWTMIHSACALQFACLEVSQDMTARRLARSAGVFMPTYQPV